MASFNNRLRSAAFFFFIYALILIAGITLLLVKGKAGSFLWLNQFHVGWLDHFFIYFTNLGDGLFAVLLSLTGFFLLDKKKPALVMLIAYSVTGIIAQVIKPLVDSPRPKAYFFPEHFNFFIDDIIHAGHTSFPSGHTTTAFAVAATVVLYGAKKWQAVLLLLLAWLVGFSRIYLSQHFLIDVLAGSLLGITGAIVCDYWCRNISPDRLLLKKNKQAR